MPLTTEKCQRVCQAVQRDRLVRTALRLIDVPSRTGEGGAVADCLAGILKEEGFKVERPAAGHPSAPAVVVRVEAKKPGRTLQFDGHLDTVHLPFVPGRIEGERLRGSGSADMKSGVAAAVEALRVLRDLLPAGAVLLTAHDLHEAPWGDGRQLNQLIAEGIVGDAVLIPEYLNHCVPTIGRGALTWKAFIRRPGPPVHEVMRPAEPSVIAAGARLITKMNELNQELSRRSHPEAGAESLFIGQVHSGEIYNQYPQECFLEGTRRWLPGTSPAEVEQQLKSLMGEVACETGTTITPEIFFIRDAFLLTEENPLLPAFQEAHAMTSGQPLPLGAKPFCDDANTFWSLAKIPAITHGPSAGGAHTLEEWVSIDDLVRVAQVYALTALGFCAS